MRHICRRESRDLCCEKNVSWIFFYFKVYILLWDWYFLLNMVTILMISPKMATLGLLKIKVFWNNGYEVITSVHDVTNKILSGDSNYIVDVFIRTKFCNSSISMREAIITLIYKDLTKKPTFFKGWSFFKFNNLGLALVMALKFYTSVAKGLKLKARKF